MKNDDSLATPQLAGYLAQELIGRGGMGEVYRALDVRLDRPVALKVLAAGVVENERARERLLVESRLAASLDHPNVVPIYEAGEQDGLLFIAMRYVPGRDLRALLRREGALAPERAVAIARQVAGALDAAHRGGLVHRDVKPSNVLLDRQDEGEHCYLADFGLTQSPSERGPTDGQFMGTVAYVSPEQIRGEQVDGRADQYGLACLLFECLTGTVPYGTRSDVAVIFAHLEEPVPPASGRPVELPAALDPVLARGMAKEPDDRYESCAALVAAVAEALGVGATPRPSRMRRALVLGAAVFALLAAGVAVALLAGDDRAKAVPPSGGLVQVDPRTNEVVGRTGIRGHPGQLAVTPGGLWMADFRGGVLWRYEPARRPAGAHHLERRAARPGRVRRQGLRRCGWPLPLGRRLPLRRRHGYSGGRDRSAGLRHGVGRRRPVGGRLPVRPAAQHRQRQVAQAGRGVLALPVSRRGWRTHGSNSARWRSARARSGSSVTPSTGGCGGWTTEPAESRPRWSSTSHRSRSR